MRIAIVVLVMIAGCTKQNPQACCTDAVDCMNVGLPEGTTCGEGLLCRGNRCVEEPCTSAGECDVTAPYCVVSDEGRCAESCTADSQCPGFSQAASDKFCVGGGCVECRAGMEDCPSDKPLCSPEGRCAACVAHADCESGVCDAGLCVSEGQIAYVATNGAPASECQRSSPCTTVERALVVAPARQYILIDAGTYASTTAIRPTGKRWLIGRGGRPVLTRSGEGPIMVVTGTVDVTLERLEIFGASGATTAALGDGISCVSPGVPKLELVDVIARMNTQAGLRGLGCNLKVTRSEFLNNGLYGVTTGEGNSLYDRCIIMSNGLSDGGGMFLDGGIHVVINSVIARNYGRGIDIYSPSNGNRIEFNTIMDNGQGSPVGSGIQCSLPDNNNIMPNNIIARNDPNETNGTCIYPMSLIIDSDISPLKLKRPDTAPYDYHLQTGSSAVDMAGSSPTKTDIDGEARPAGAANDIGADELH